MKYMRSSSGQIGIILLLVTVVMLTVGISVVSQTTSDVDISITNESANQALDAAESGVENALGSDLNSYTGANTTVGDINVNTNVVKATVLESIVEQGYAVGVDVSTADKSRPLIINWAKSTTPSQQASLVVSVFSNTAPYVRRFYVGLATATADSNRNQRDGFANALTTADSGYSLRTDIALQASDYLVRIRPLYAAAELRVRGTNLPTQQYVVVSTAQNTTTKETKAVQVERGIPVPPSVFDYVLYAGGSITP